MNALNTVPTEFIHVSDQEFERDFLSDQQKIVDHFGKVVKQRSFIKTKCLSHIEAANFVGGYAMHSVMTTSFRFWSSDSSNAKDVTIWTRLVWQLANVYALGFLYSRYRFGNQINESWNPLKKTATQYEPSQRFSYSPSKRTISGATLSQAIYCKLFPETIDTLTSMQVFALFDVFSANPNVDNPLYVALRNAFRHTIFHYQYPVPYFWEEFMQHLLSQSSEDKVLFEHYLNSTHEQSVSNVTNIGSIHHNAQPQTPKGESTNKEHNPSGTAALTKPDDDQLIQKLGQLVKESLINGIHRVNCQKALLHVVDGKYCFVHPFAFAEMEKLLRQATPNSSITKEQLIEYFTERGFALICQGTLTPKNNTPRPIHLAEINPRLIARFIPSSMELHDNPDISLDKCL